MPPHAAGVPTDRARHHERSRQAPCSACSTTRSYGPVTVDGFYGPETQAAIKELTDNFECCIEQPLLVRTWYWTILFAQSHRLRGLELGDSGVRVKTLQRALRADGETVVVDGDFGAQTKAQVKVFQDKCDIEMTGRVNDQTSFFFSQGGCRRLDAIRNETFLIGSYRRARRTTAEDEGVRRWWTTGSSWSGCP